MNELQKFNENVIVNLTPHEITLFSGDKIVNKYLPSGNTARIDMEGTSVGLVVEYELDGMNADDTDGPEGRDGEPEKKDGVMYIVSLPYLLYMKAAGVWRDDIVAPDTHARAVRDPNGRIQGVRGFMRLAD